MNTTPTAIPVDCGDAIAEQVEPARKCGMGVVGFVVAVV